MSNDSLQKEGRRQCLMRIKGICCFSLGVYEKTLYFNIVLQPFITISHIIKHQDGFFQISHTSSNRLCHARFTSSRKVTQLLHTERGPDMLILQGLKNSNGNWLLHLFRAAHGRVTSIMMASPGNELRSLLSPWEANCGCAFCRNFISWRNKRFLNYP